MSQIQIHQLRTWFDTGRRHRRQMTDSPWTIAASASLSPWGHKLKSAYIAGWWNEKALPSFETDPADNPS